MYRGDLIDLAFNFPPTATYQASEGAQTILHPAALFGMGVTRPEPQAWRGRDCNSGAGQLMFVRYIEEALAELLKEVAVGRIGHRFG